MGDCVKNTGHCTKKQGDLYEEEKKHGTLYKKHGKIV